MQAIGLVPWVRRTADADALAQIEQALAPPVDAPLVEAALTAGSPTERSPTEGSPTVSRQSPLEASVVVSGNADSQLILIFDVRDEGSWPLSKADDALLEGMLRAISMSKASVFSCAIVQEASMQTTSEQPSDLKNACQSPRKHFLYFGGNAIAADAVDPIPMSQASTDGVIDGWQLPTLAMLRKTPQRKRQAWVTLKKLRSSLDHN